ncbi:sirohydrochlorin chelatase [Moritella yayanosii]|uniref:Putative Sirohydrochlorin cobaltochelatase cbiX n=2 Tax=Alteromonadales TaxID=135622 RepID=A0A330LVE7_9GAMM|nr:sirohydrochlorin chelatase [Moritella yayanosii]SQD80276.1 putative Sirohydrochlorin cobaltochelatase cbiX [Moritella yayanosii]
MTTIATLPETSGVLICGHGSRAKIAEEEFSLLAKGLKERHPELKVEYGFLEYSAPNLHTALDRLVAQGVTKIHAVPGMLFAATHAKNDIPSVLTTYQAKHPNLTIEYGKELGLHDEMIMAFQQRILNALGHDTIPAAGELYDTMLVVVGRGTSVVDANADAAKLTRIACENLGFGWSETVYSGVTFPSVGRGLEMALKLGFKKIVVAPYFLFGGKLIDRIYNYVDKVANENPDVTFFKADYLRAQDHVINTFELRINETIAEPAPSITLMADFQARLARGEVDVHHHHAEFKAEGEHSHEHSNSHEHNNSHSHDHSHSHRHGHHHAPYKHIAHPHGPRTMVNDNICGYFMSQLPEQIIAEEKAAGDKN